MPIQIKAKMRGSITPSSPNLTSINPARNYGCRVYVSLRIQDKALMSDERMVSLTQLASGVTSGIPG